jgi:hypothetical protein
MILAIQSTLFDLTAEVAERLSGQRSRSHM